MKLKYNNEEIELVYSFRINVYYEQIQNKSIDFENFKTQDLITLFYCCFITSLQKINKPICTMLEFLDVLDENGGEPTLMEFSNWFTKVLTAQYEMINSTVNKEDKEDLSKKKQIKINT